MRADFLVGFCPSILILSSFHILKNCSRKLRTNMSFSIRSITLSCCDDSSFPTRLVMLLSLHRKQRVSFSILLFALSVQVVQNRFVLLVVRSLLHTVRRRSTGWNERVLAGRRQMQFSFFLHFFHFSKINNFIIKKVKISYPFFLLFRI